MVAGALCLGLVVCGLPFLHCFCRSDGARERPSESNLLGARTHSVVVNLVVAVYKRADVLCFSGKAALPRSFAFLCLTSTWGSSGGLRPLRHCGLAPFASREAYRPLVASAAAALLLVALLGFSLSAGAFMQACWTEAPTGRVGLSLLVSRLCLFSTLWRKSSLERKPRSFCRFLSAIFLYVLVSHLSRGF